MDKAAVQERSLSKSAIKKERINDDIKEYAETAMNELLGWYGYGETRKESKTSKMCNSHSGSNSSGPDSPKFLDVCGWCGKTVEENTGLSSASNIFCSELCFAQSRRASFKKNKTCDWCRHVRHTVSYVDFQDGASQLQFCSDKCLNQYKMHIFCRETRAHLEMHPHLHGDETSTTGLITPDLWMKNCKSPESHSSSPPMSPKLPETQPQTSPLPLITVAHPSKLMPISSENNEPKRHRNKLQKKQRKRYPLNSPGCINYNSKPTSSETAQDLRIRHSPVEQRNEILNNKPTNRIFNPLLNTPNNLSSHSQTTNSPFFNPTNLNRSERNNTFENLIPPITVMVPYPIILPLPIPIPIPIPLSTLLAMDAKNHTENTQDNNKSSQVVNGKAEDIKDTKDANDAKDASQINNEDDKVVLENDTEGGDTVSTTPIAKPPRKRKRIVDSKSRIVLKSKKSVPV